MTMKRHLNPGIGLSLNTPEIILLCPDVFFLTQTDAEHDEN
jgi:hypothetical protein